MDTYTYVIEKSEPQYNSPFMGTLYRNGVMIDCIFGHSKRTIKSKFKEKVDRERNGPKVVDSGEL